VSGGRPRIIIAAILAAYLILALLIAWVIWEATHGSVG
jgi:hypothetical protein